MITFSFKKGQGYVEATIDMDEESRDELFRLKGYLEGVLAPHDMQKAYNQMLDLISRSPMIMMGGRVMYDADAETERG